MCIRDRSKQGSNDYTALTTGTEHEYAAPMAHASEYVAPVKGAREAKVYDYQTRPKRDGDELMYASPYGDDENV